MFAILLLILEVQLESGLRLRIDAEKPLDRDWDATPPNKSEVPCEFCRDEPVSWMTPSGVNFDDDVVDWIQFAGNGTMPRSFTRLFQRLHEKDNQEESEFLENAWETGQLKGLFLSIPPGDASQHQIELEEGDTLLFAYRVQEKDIRFNIEKLGAFMIADVMSAPVLYQTTVFREHFYSSTGSSVVGFWKPPPSHFSDIASTAMNFSVGIVQNGSDGADPNNFMPSMFVPTCTVDLVWDNGYSWLTSKNVVALVGILKNSRRLLGFWGGPLDLLNYSFDQSQLNLSQMPSIAVGAHPIVADAHPLDQRQCVEAKTRAAEKTGFGKDMALIGYLLEVGLKVTEDLKASVEDEIDNDCDIPAAGLTVSSHVNFLTQTECQEAMARAGSKEGGALEFELRKYLKELARNVGEEMMKRVTEQISSGCVPASEQRLSTEQCHGMKMFVQSATGPVAQIEAIKIGLRSFGMPEYQHLVAEMCKQMAEGCGQASSIVQIEDDHENPLPQTCEKKPLTLTANECRQAQEAMDGKETMYAEFHMSAWCQDQGKAHDTKTVNIVLDKLHGDCGASRGRQLTMFKDNVLVEKVSPAAAESILVEQPAVKESERPGTVSSGSIRRQDFVQDERFAKYRKMKKLQQPRASVQSKLLFDKRELLQTGLTEADLDCFVLLLYGDDECNVAPKGSSYKVLTQEFLEDSRVKKYMMMDRLGQTREMIESKLVFDKAKLLNEGLTEADIDCFKKLLFEGVGQCDASPAGKILGPEFVDADNPFFNKYRTMYKIRQTKAMVMGKITQDMPELKKLGFSKTEMDCFVRLLFKETTICICGPAQRSEDTSKEARNLALAKEAHEKLASLLDGDSGLLPAVLPSLGWATDVFEAVIPKTAAPKRKRAEPKESKKLENFLDEDPRRNLNIILSGFPKTDPVGDPLVWETILAEIAQGEFTVARELDAEPMKEDLELIKRALDSITDADVKAVKPHIEKITDKHDASHRFAKALVPFLDREGASLKDIVDCMVSTKTFGDSIRGPPVSSRTNSTLDSRLDSLAKLLNDYKDFTRLVSTLATASGGFIVQLLDARLAMIDSETAHSKRSIDLYDTILREFRRKAGFSDGDETVGSVVPLLALFNVIIDKSKRLRPGLVQTDPELAERLSPTYLELFMLYIHRVVLEEDRQAVHGDPEEPLTHMQCENAKTAIAAASPEYKEEALKNYLTGIQKLPVIALVEEQVEKPCAKPVVLGPLTQQECEKAIEIFRRTPNQKFQLSEVDEYFEEIGKIDQRIQAHAQVQAGCPSGKPKEPLHKISTLLDQCNVVLEKPEPSTANSVRGVVAGIAATQRAVKKCVFAMPALKQGVYEDLMEEAQVVLETSKEIQEAVFEVMIQSSGPFLPHDSKGNVDRTALSDLVKSLPQAGSKEDKKRIYGGSLPATFKISDFLDDEALRYATRKICLELVAANSEAEKSLGGGS